MLNKVMLIGRLGADVELNHLASGNAIAKFQLATSRRWKDKQSGEKKEETEWHRITFFGRTAEVCAEYLKKGSQIYIEGRIKTDKYEKNGVDTYSTGIIGDRMNMLGMKNNSDSQGTQQNKPPYAQQKQQPVANNQEDFDDDVPF